MYNKAQNKIKKNPWNDKSKTNNTAIKAAVNECNLVWYNKNFGTAINIYSRMIQNKLEKNSSTSVISI